MQDDRQELLAQLFVMLTAKIENAHEVAIAGQGGGIERKPLLSLAHQLREFARDVIAIAEVIMILTDKPAH